MSNCKCSPSHTVLLLTLSTSLSWQRVKGSSTRVGCHEAMPLQYVNPPALAYLQAYHAFTQMRGEEVTGDGARLNVGVGRGDDHRGCSVLPHHLLLFARHHDSLLNRQARADHARQLRQEV